MKFRAESLQWLWAAFQMILVRFYFNVYSIVSFFVFIIILLF